jgi:putative inorganic carbon (HCO3(-)) transporter
MNMQRIMDVQYRLWRRTDALRDLVESISPELLAVALGLALGTMMVLRNGLSDKWAGALVMAVPAIVFVLLVGDLKKMILLTLVLDVPLNFDVAIQNHELHSGGPTGFIISLATFALVAGYVSWIVNRSPRARGFYGVTMPGLAFLFTVVLSVFQSGNVQFSLFSIFMIAQFLLMYFYLVNRAASQEDIRFILTVLAACLLVESMFMILQYFTGINLNFAGIQTRSQFDLSQSVGGVRRVAGTIGSPNAAASYLAPALAITFGAYLTNGKLVNKSLAFAAFGLGTVALIFTSVRSGWISFAIAMTVIVFQAMRMETLRKAVLVLLIFGAFVGIFFSGRIIDRFTKDDNNSALSREWSAQMARNIMEDYPLGVGTNNYDQVMSYKYAPRELIGHTLYVVHNKYLLIRAETGWVGLLAFVWLLLAAIGQGIKWIIKSDAPPHLVILATSLMGALIGYSVNMSSETFGGRIRDQWLWFMIAMIVMVSQLIIKSMSENARDVQR